VKRPLVIMVSIIGAMLVVTALAVGGYFYIQAASRPKVPKPPTPTELKSLLVDLPENTTNTKDGLIQFTVHLQAADSKTKSALNDILPMVQDAVNQCMHEFSDADLKAVDGQTRLKLDIERKVNALLTGGLRVTEVYFSTWVVQ
jgi:flagellar basal body-associated protein FliL